MYNRSEANLPYGLSLLTAAHQVAEGFRLPVQMVLSYTLARGQGLVAFTPARTAARLPFARSEYPAN